MKPTRDERAKKQRAILDAATKLFLEKGYEATSINTLVSITGGSKETIYNNFGNKEQLFVAVVDDVLKGILQPLAELDIHHLALREGLIYISKITLEVLTDEKGVGLQRLAFSASRKHENVGRLFYEHGPVKGFASLAKFLRKQQALGKFDCRNIDHATEYFWGMLLYKVTLQRCCSVESPMSSRNITNLVHRVVDDFLEHYAN